MTYTYFCFFTYKSDNVKAAMSAISMLAIEPFLSNTFLVVFAFLITKIVMRE